ncbi:MAG: hypothetical protein HQL05_10955 [Nitrospirae bacterium]|uniref:hypothetical protein n=1 Tax=Candidatus Magnetobacterium casense TaxID=1455061 RepID=UPI00058C6DCB|nr:hypothetical protein [Candidatus Magnetobacterium casensis]MBF0338339.1 hypothetical protein [Nitrospirota bacterium]
MKGIQYMTDDNGDRTAVVIDLKQYGNVWEDFYDTLTASERKDEPRETIAVVKKRLMQKRKLLG